MLAQDGLDRREVALGRHDHAAGSHERLGDEGRHGLRPLGADALVELARQRLGELARRLARIGVAVVVRTRHVQEAREREVERRLHRGHPAEARGCDGRAVISAHARDDLFLLGTTAQVVEVPDEPHLRVVRVRSGGSEEDLAHVGGRELEQAGRALDGGRVRHPRKRVVVGQPARLLCDRVRDLAATVAGVHAPKPRHGIEVLAPLAVADAQSAALGHHDRPPLEVVGDHRERVDQALSIEVGQAAFAAHGGLLLRAEFATPGPPLTE